ncbi:unnamed protein product, partial [marine sediment metagenome]
MIVRCTLVLVVLFTLGSCKGPALPSDAQIYNLNRKPLIFPDYTGITIPNNIAPLNFEVKDEGKSFMAVLEGDKGAVLKLKAVEKIFSISPKKWIPVFTGEQRIAVYRSGFWHS